LVELLSLIEPTFPIFAVRSTTAGVTDSPPAACAVAALPRTPTQAIITGAARSRVFTDTMREQPSKDS